MLSVLPRAFNEVTSGSLKMLARVTVAGGLVVRAMDIEWNSLGDGQAHTLVVEAVDQLGPAPQANLYSGLNNTPVVSPMPAGAMLGGDKGATADGKVSTNGQGPYTNNPQVI